MTAGGMDVLAAFGGYQGAFAGAERMAWRTATALAGRGNRVETLTDSPQVAGFRTVASLDAARPGWRPDVVHAYDLAKPAHVELAWQLARRHRVGFALTPCSVASVWPEPERARELCRAADVLFVLTDAERAELTGIGVAPQRIVSIPQAPDLTARADPSAFRRRYNITGPVVLFAARRVSFKGYRALLAATRLVWRERPDTTFVFLGADGEPEAVEAFRAHRDPRIRDLGMVDEQTKHDAFADCAVFCLPTSDDVFPLAFVEAWACGKPVVSGRFPGVDEVVRHGVDGLVAEAAPGPVAAALLRLLGDARARAAMGEAGRRRTAERFNWDRVAAIAEAGYRSIDVAGIGRRA